MNDNENIARIICEKLENHSPLILASLVTLHGSSPRHGGAKLVVDGQSKSFGTIGGSLLEATVVTEAIDALSKRQSRLMSFDLAGENAYAKDMICGGTTKVLLDFVSDTPENIRVFKSMHDVIREGRVFFFLTAYKEQDQAVEVLGHAVLTPDGKIVGNDLWNETDLDLIKAESRGLPATTVVPIGDTHVVIDPVRRIETLYCFGAGHVALPTAHLAALAGFRVVVLDDRAAFANKERFPEADEVRVIDDFMHAMEGLSIDEDSYIVIVTRGHAFDRIVLEQSLKTTANYIGMISSRRKKEIIYQALIAQGVSEEALARVHSPIGIPIGGETPAEISISIVAELISERYKKK